jgi:hypothetical protein
MLKLCDREEYENWQNLLIICSLFNLLKNFYINIIHLYLLHHIFLNKDIADRNSRMMDEDNL